MDGTRSGETQAQGHRFWHALQRIHERTHETEPMAETVPMPSVWTGGTVDPEAGDLITHTCVGLAGGVIALFFVWMYTKEIEAFPDGPPGNDRTLLSLPLCLRITRIRRLLGRIGSATMS